ncbi:MAG: hypothetical protein KBB91_02060 [Candidatus Pacebacteria bacterium]|jgi:predicted RND superfamily exporter protein|nr:hypothetical protein [Candidatus Paceibacterota bacterium]MBP9701340.1 hypothetical protein [Candidatus Paceibacterota bacterium]
MKKQTKGSMSAGKVAAIGAGVAALAAASYYFFGPEGQKHRKTAKGWMLKMKAEIVEKMENAKEMTQSTYDTIVDTVAKKYQKNPEIGMMVDMLKKQWRGISKSTTGAKKTVKKAVKKSAPKKVAKK